MQTVSSMTGGVESTSPRLNLPVVVAPPLIPWMKLRRLARASISLLRQRAAAIWPKVAAIALAVMLAPTALLAGLGTSSITMGSAGGSSSVVVATSGYWTATANDLFLHTSSSGTGNGLVVFTVDQFTGPGTRTGTLTIAGSLLTVTQLGTDYTAVNPVTTIVPPSAGLSHPDQLAVDASGNVYIADTGNNAVKEWSAATQGVTTLVSSGLNAPDGVAVDGAGNVYIADTAHNAIQEWSSGSGLTTLVSSGLTGPWGVAADGSGNIYIADTGDSAIKEWSSGSGLTTVASAGNEINSPTGVALDASANIYIANTPTKAVLVWNHTTELLTTLIPSSSGLNGPSQLAVDGSGNVYIADTNNGAIKEWVAATQTLTTLMSGLYFPEGVAVDGSGNVYAADTGNNPSDVGVNSILELTRAFVGPASLTEPSSAGSDSLLQVIPAATPLNGLFAPTSDQAWLTFENISNGVVSFHFEANTTGAPRVGNITILGQVIPVTQMAAQSITFGALTDHVYGTPPFAISASASSGLMVSFASTTPLICTVSGSTVTLVAAGQCTVRATQGGNASFTAAAAIDRSFQVTQAGQSITFGTLSNQVYGTAPFAISATASSGLLVSFASTTPLICSVSTPTLTAGVSYATVTLVSGGGCSIQATQGGNADYSPAGSVTEGFTVTQAGQSISFGTLADHVYGTAPFTVSATASSGLTVSFTSTTTGVCTVSGSSLTAGVSSATVTLVSGGPCSIQTTQAGNADYSPAGSVTEGFTVTQASQSISFGTLSNQVYGTAPYTISASASSGLLVSFASTTPLICSISNPSLTAGVSYATVTLVSGGGCSITATQAGNADYFAADSVTRGFTVTQAQTGLGISAPAVTYGVTGSVTVTVVTTLTPTPTGTITLTVDSGAGVTKTASGGAATFGLGVLAAGSHPLSVSYSGDTDYLPISAAQAAVLLANPVLVVNKAATAAAIAVTGQTVTATVSVTPPGAGAPTGTVQFMRGSTVLGTVPLGGLTATLSNVPAGPVTAVYSGDSNFLGSASSMAFVVTSSLSLGGNANPSALGVPVTFTATLITAGAPGGSVPSGTVEFLDGALALSTTNLVNGQATYTTTSLNGGTHNIVAQYSGDGTFPAAQASYLQIVRALAVPVATVSPAASVYGQPVTFTATVTRTAAAAAAGYPAPTGQVSFYLSTTEFVPLTLLGTADLSSTGRATFTTTGFAAGINFIAALYDGDSVWLANYVVVTVTVGQAATSSSVSLAVVGGQLTLTAAVAAVAPGAGVPTGSVQFVDKTTNTVIATASLTNGRASANAASNVAAQPIVAVYSGDTNFQASTSAPLPTPTNAAALLTAAFAPDEIASVFNVIGLSGDTGATQLLSTSLGGATVTITDSTGTVLPAPLYGVFGDEDQINLVIPSGTAPGPATVTITLPGGGTLSTAIVIGTTAPGVFTANQNGQGVFAGQVVYGNLDGSQTYASPAVWNPATKQYDDAPINLGPAGEQVYLVLYGTGIRHAGAVAASVNGVSLPVAYFGAQSQYPGLDQLNLQVPASLAGAGLVDLVVTVDGQPANTVTFDIE